MGRGLGTGHHTLRPHPLACNLNGYGNLCQFITKLRRSSEKGSYHLDLTNIQGAAPADDLHVAQFAALLRTLSKGMDRQVVVAIHERALSAYLTLELSPAFPGDSLITVEVTRSFEGATVMTPHAFSFEKDQAIAA